MTSKIEKKCQSSSEEESNLLECSFCGMNQEEATILIGGGGDRVVFICDRCVELCVGVVFREYKKRVAGNGP